MIASFKILIPLLLAASAPAAPTGGDHRLIILDALKSELGRAKQKLRLPGEDSPYFIRYIVRDYDNYDLSARFGALFEDN